MSNFRKNCKKFANIPKFQKVKLKVDNSDSIIASFLMDV